MARVLDDRTTCKRQANERNVDQHRERLIKRFRTNSRDDFYSIFLPTYKRILFVNSSLKFQRSAFADSHLFVHKENMFQLKLKLKMNIKMDTVYADTLKSRDWFATPLSCPLPMVNLQQWSLKQNHKIKVNKTIK